MTSVTTSLIANRRPRSAAWRSEDRWLAAACLLTCAAVHVPLIGEHLREAPYAGVAFLVFVVTATVLAAAVVVHDTGAVWAAVGLVAGAAIAAYVLSRMVALPQLGDDLGSWREPLSFPALGAELVALAVTRAAWSARRRSHRVTV